jgi:hypothetical protein
MEASLHTLNNLFAQLGLPNTDEEIESFIQTHSHLAGYMTLAEAPYWTSAQAAFLREEILKDADWAEVIDQLNTRLHKK